MTLNPAILPEIAAHADTFIGLRHAIHAHPELGFEEEQTSVMVAEQLRSWGYEVTTGLGKTGVVAQLKLGDGDKKLGIRADMDALPIQETTGLPYASRIDGCMHACGHDGHTATLLAAAHHLAHARSFNGTLNLIFQPAEEGLGGAKRMIEDGLFTRFPCDSIFSLHNAPGVPVGAFALRTGAMAASSDTMRITLTGKGTHGSMPHVGQDPIVAAASIVMALQTIVSRNVPAQDTAVVSVGMLQAGAAANVVPESAKLALTLRALNPEVRDLVERRVQDVVEHQAKSFNVRAEITHTPIARVVMNAPKETDLARSVLTDMLGKERVIEMPTAVMGSEDFSWMLEQVPGCYVLMGNGIGQQGGCMIHNPGYDFNDEALALGASFWVRLAERFLV
jgi:hippurate hydrolase